VCYALVVDGAVALAELHDLGTVDISQPRCRGHSLLSTPGKPTMGSL
tara:strand:- start:219 stop:359 length:141 start_codon:yes stop_codon:yes gene_type:complete